MKSVIVSTHRGLRHHPQSNGAAERVVRSVKTMLVAKIGNGHHDWPALLHQLRMEYMQRRHSVTGCSPKYLVYAHQLRLPPPIGELHWDATMAALAPTPPRRHRSRRTLPRSYTNDRHEFVILSPRCINELSPHSAQNPTVQLPALQPNARGGGNYVPVILPIYYQKYWFQD